MKIQFHLEPLISFLSWLPFQDTPVWLWNYFLHKHRDVENVEVPAPEDFISDHGNLKGLHPTNATPKRK